ncbi:MAG: ABC transporter ATP-binding protein [Candidatus Hinthialibacter antarcticus]|nr:ABC transporter ATP-binding protein [Candidatus Hinthialibacter antarcticus]
MNSLLRLQGVTRRFGGLTAVSQVDLEISPKLIFAVIGPNGAGKTTLFNLICGVFPTSEGKIHFDGTETNGRATHQVARLGISRTFQTAELFHNLSILENVMVGRHLRSRCGMFSSALRMPWERREERAIQESAKEWLSFVGVDDNYGSLPSNLPFVVHRKTEIARALATEPKLILLDEPAAGLNIRETAEMGELVCKIRDAGVTVLIIEHDMSLVMDISDSICVLNHGSKIAQGAPKEIQKNAAVIAAYLGKEASDADRN